MNDLLKWLSMGGYGFYVWSSYGLVFVTLAVQLIRPWRNWRKIRKQEHVHTK